MPTKEHQKLRIPFLVVKYIWYLELNNVLQERLLDEMKVEEGEDGEVDENGVTISSRKVGCS